MPDPSGDTGLPRLASGILRVLLPAAEREEVLSELGDEYRERRGAHGRAHAMGWLWRQVLASAPALIGRGWWRGWSGFEPRANRWRPGGSMFESFGKDLRFGLRRLRRRPTYTTVAVLTLALGVAGTAAVYSIVKQLLVEPLPYRAEEEVAVFWNPFDWSEAEFAYLRPEMEGFRNVAMYRSADATLHQGDAPARLVPAVSTTAELFQVLGISPELGPGFRPGDDVLGADPVAVLGHSLWTDLGADPSIVGQRLELAGVPRTVVGVMPEGFWFPDPEIQLWLAEEIDPENGSGNYAIVARTAAGTSTGAMDASVDRITTLLGQRFDYPEQWDKTRNAALTPVREFLLGSVRPALLATLGAMALLLLIACVNVSALMLGQVDSRGSELAVRTALGAGQTRLIQQLVIESLAIGLLAGLVGAGLAMLGFEFLVNALPLGMMAGSAAVDWTLFAAAVGVALVAATAVALVPGVSIARSDIQNRLARSRTSGVAGRGGRLESALVVAQVALVLLMAAGAALLIRSVANLRAIDPGVETAGIAVVDVTMPVSTEMLRRPQLLRDLVDAVEALPGVQTAAATQTLPLRGGGNNWGIVIEGQPEGDRGTTFVRLVTADYFETLGITVANGRGLQETDAFGETEGAVVINQALAERYFPGMDPIGQRIGTIPDRMDRVVGVVNDVAEGNLTDDPEPARYLLFEGVELILPGQTIVLRTQPGTGPTSVLDAARQAIQTAAPGVAVREVTTMENVLTRAIGPARQVMSLLSLLGGLALALGTVGVYGVVSHFVVRRKRDWGIRLALGMRPGRVVGQIVTRGGALVGTGIILGLVAFLLMARLLASFLYGVDTADPLALIGAIAILLGAGLLAAYLPAQRASRIDPALVLRE